MVVPWQKDRIINYNYSCQKWCKVSITMLPIRNQMQAVSFCVDFLLLLDSLIYKSSLFLHCFA